jgi:glycosyltransferase involved in cell wall biosynthesis
VTAADGPLATIIIPVFNGGRFLAGALESCFAQDYQPVEVIVVDDGSTDDSAEIARSYDVRCLNQPNQGPAAARNLGLGEARGRLVAFLDSDDVMLPNKISAQAGHLRAHPETGCVLTGHELVVDPGVDPPRWMLGPQAPDVVAISMLVRREVFATVGPFDPSFRVHEDVEWLMRARADGIGIDILPTALLRRRIHGDNLSYQTSLIRAEMLRATKQTIDARRRVP